MLKDSRWNDHVLHVPQISLKLILVEVEGVVGGVVGVEGFLSLSNHISRAYRGFFPSQPHDIRAKNEGQVFRRHPVVSFEDLDQVID